MSNKREGGPTKSESFRASMEQLEAAMKAVFGCTFDEFMSSTYQSGFIHGYLKGCADQRAEANRKKNLRRPGKNAARGFPTSLGRPLSQEELLERVDPRSRESEWAALQRSRQAVPKRRRSSEIDPSSLEFLAEIAVDDDLGDTVIARIKTCQKMVRESEDYEFLHSRGWPLVTKTPTQLKAAYYNMKTRQRRASKGD
jgi:hypothetical protein